MQPGDPVIARFETFLASATIAAHARAFKTGFRQRDVKFLLELFSNWLESAMDGPAVQLQNTQIARYLAGLVHQGAARRISRKGPPVYRLTRLGLLELVQRTADRTTKGQRVHFLFKYYFIKNYRSHIESLIKSEGREFPAALRIELEALLNPEALLQEEIAETERDLSKLGLRIHDAQRTSELMIKGRKQGRALAELTREAQRLYPYDLNSQKPLTELIDSIPAELQAWELETGNMMRAAEIWQPIQEMLRGYLAGLRKISGLKDNR